MRKLTKSAPLWLAISIAISIAICFVMVGRRQDFDSNRVYRIGIDDAPPLSAMQSNGKLGGLAVDILNEAARRRGIQLEWIEGRTESPDDLLKSGKVDLWPVVAVMPERLKWYHMTRPWMSNTFSLITRKHDYFHEPADLIGKKVAFTGFPLATKVARQTFPASTLAAQPTRNGVLEAVCLGLADGGFEEASFVNATLLKRPDACSDVELTISLIPSAVAEGAIASRRDAAGAADALRAEITNLATDGTLALSLDRWASFSASETRSVLHMQAAGRRQKQMLWYALFAAVLISGGLLWQVRITSVRKLELAKVLESTSDSVVLLDSAWRITYLNEHAKAQISRGRNLQGCNLWQDFPHLAHTPCWSAFHQAVKEQRIIRLEYFFENLQKCLEIQACPSPGRLAIFFRDVTEQNKVNEELQRRRKQLDDTSMNIPGAVYQFTLAADGTARFPFISAGIEKLLGVSAEAITQDSQVLFGAIVPEDLPEVMQSIARSARTMSLWESSCRIQTSGGVKWVSGRSVPQRLPSGEILWNGVLIDISDQKRAQEELAVARDRAEAASRAKSAFLAAMSHEVRTPLNGIVGSTGLLLDTPLNPEQKDLLSTIRTSGELLLTVVNDILDFSKIEAEKMEIESAPFALHELLEGVLDIAGDAADRKGIDIELRVAQDVPNHVMGDPQRIKQVMLNLVGNAVKFTETGEVVISVETAKDSQEPRVRIAIRDTGIGIPFEMQTQLFQSFFQGDSSMSRRFGGTGLGLAIAKRLSALMGGGLEVASEPHKGSTFTVELPLQPQAIRPATAAMPGRDRTLLLSEQPASDATMTALSKARLDVFPVVADSHGLQAALLLTGKPLSAFPYCLAALTGSHEEILRQAKSFRLAASEVTPLPLALLPSLRRRTIRELKRQGWACLSQPFQSERIREYLDRGAPKSGKNSSKARLAGLNARVLVAEDNAVNQTVARRMLERLGCQVDIAHNGKEAVAAAASGAYDVIFMDCQMPEMDGFQATEAIRKAEHGRHRTPVVAMTAHAIAGDRELCIAAGMDDYVSKPVRLETLSSVLGKWLGEEPGPHGIAQLGTALRSGGVYDKVSVQ